jgi:hypothetical protein
MENNVQLGVKAFLSIAPYGIYRLVRHFLDEPGNSAPLATIEAQVRAVTAEVCGQALSASVTMAERSERENDP